MTNAGVRPTLEDWWEAGPAQLLTELLNPGLAVSAGSQKFHKVWDLADAFMEPKG